MGFSKEELQAQYGRTVPDLVGPGLKLLFVGINPGLWTAATQTHFSYPGNRFYPALHRAGITPRPIDPAEGMDDDDRAMFVGLGLGITNVVQRATARADELGKEEFVEGGARLTAFVEEWKPTVVAIAGLGAYRTAFGRPKAKKGPQEDRIGPAEVWLTGNPSGLNAHETVGTLADQFRTIAVRAGVVDEPSGTLPA